MSFFTLFLLFYITVCFMFIFATCNDRYTKLTCVGTFLVMVQWTGFVIGDMGISSFEHFSVEKGYIFLTITFFSHIFFLVSKGTPKQKYVKQAKPICVALILGTLATLYLAESMHYVTMVAFVMATHSTMLARRRIMKKWGG